jgi:predicted deacylase
MLGTVARRGALLLLLLTGCVLPRPIETLPPEPAATAMPPPPVARAPHPPAQTWRVLARTPEGRPIRVRTVGTGPRRVLWIGGIHGDEREGAVATAELPAAFLAIPGLAEAVTLTIVEDANPDGTAAGTRANARGVDLNRNYPARNFAASRGTGRAPLDQVEARALHDLIESQGPHLVIVAHGSVGRRFINGDGPTGAMVRRFSRLSGYPAIASRDLHATPGSLGSWVGRDRGIPILTLEYRKGDDPRLVWLETREAILDAIAGEP